MRENVRRELDWLVDFYQGETYTVGTSVPRTPSGSCLVAVMVDRTGSILVFGASNRAEAKQLSDEICGYLKDRSVPHEGRP